jgi:hypothetical protein
VSEESRGSAREDGDRDPMRDEPAFQQLIDDEKPSRTADGPPYDGAGPQDENRRYNPPTVKAIIASSRGS